MKKRRAKKHSSEIHFFIINALLVAGLIAAGLWIQKGDSDMAPITPATTATVVATAPTTPPITNEIAPSRTIATSTTPAIRRRGDGDRD